MGESSLTLQRDGHNGGEVLPHFYNVKTKLFEPLRFFGAFYGLGKGAMEGSDPLAPTEEQ